jgi:ribosome-associated heat shock protein Hsp15
MGPYEHIIDVTGVSSTRGSATIAATLYKETDASKRAREAMALHVRAMNANTGYESGRPTKKDRRDIEKVRRRDY